MVVKLKGEGGVLGESWVGGVLVGEVRLDILRSRIFVII